MLVRRGSAGGPEFTIIDWSEVGVCEPYHDVGQLILSDVDADVATSTVLPKVCSAYFHALTKRLPRNVPRSSLPTSVQHVQRATLRAGAERWVVLLALMGGMPATSVPDSIIAYWAGNLGEWVRFMDASAGARVEMGVKTLVVLPPSSR